MAFTSIEIIWVILSSLFVILFFSITIFVFITGFKIMKVWNYLNIKYLDIQKQIPAFLRKKDIASWYKENHDFLKSTVRRFCFFEALSKKKSEEYFSKAYNMNLIRTIKDKNLENDFYSLIKFSKIRDIYIVLFYINFSLLIVVTILYPFI